MVLFKILEPHDISMDNKRLKTALTDRKIEIFERYKSLLVNCLKVLEVNNFYYKLRSMNSC